MCTVFISNFIVIVFEAPRTFRHANCPRNFRVVILISVHLKNFHSPEHGERMRFIVWNQKYGSIKAGSFRGKRKRNFRFMHRIYSWHANRKRVWNKFQTGETFANWWLIKFSAHRNIHCFFFSRWISRYNLVVCFILTSISLLCISFDSLIWCI